MLFVCVYVVVFGVCCLYVCMWLCGRVGIVFVGGIDICIVLVGMLMMFLHCVIVVVVLVMCWCVVSSCVVVFGVGVLGLNWCELSCLCCCVCVGDCVRVCVLVSL